MSDEAVVSSQEAQVRDMVRTVLRRTLGLTKQPAAQSSPAVTEHTIAEAAPGDTLRVAPGTLITPLARDAARERAVTIVEAQPVPDRGPDPTDSIGVKTVAIGADHGGYELKRQPHRSPAQLRHAPLGLATFSTQSADYSYQAPAAAAAGGASAGGMSGGAGGGLPGPNGAGSGKASAPPAMAGAGRAGSFPGAVHGRARGDACATADDGIGP